MKVSIIMPVYNVEKFIKQSIESILNQDHKDFELIIVDDGSTDKTSNYIEPYLADNRLQYYNFGRLGKVEAFNKGYEKAVNDFVCFFHGDDLMTRDSIVARLNPLMKSSPELVACCGKLQTKSSHSKYDSVIIPKGRKGSLSGQAVMYKKALTDIIFPIPKLLPNEDFWMRLHIEHFSDNLIHIDNVIAKYRIHEQNSFLSIGALQSFEEKNEKIYIRRTYVLNEFIKKYNNLDIEKIRKIRSYLEAEEHRYKGRFLGILFSNISIRNKLRFLFESSAFMYQIKNRFSSLFLGRG